MFKETAFSLSLAITAVASIVLFITASLQTTLIVVFVIILVNVFMVGGVYYLGLHMNMVLTLNMSFCLGVAVDYTTHIAHTFQMVKAPAEIKSVMGQRAYKASKAISLMGSSVFHGGFSTFLAISVLYKAKVYSI